MWRCARTMENGEKNYSWSIVGCIAIVRLLELNCGEDGG